MKFFDLSKAYISLWARSFQCRLNFSILVGFSVVSTAIPVSSVIALSLVTYVLALSSSDLALQIKAFFLFPFYVITALYLLKRGSIGADFGFRRVAVICLIGLFFLYGSGTSAADEIYYYAIRVLNFFCVLLLVMSLSMIAVKQFFFSLSLFSIFCIFLIFICGIEFSYDGLCYFSIPFFFLCKSKSLKFILAVPFLIFLYLVQIRGVLLAIILIFLHDYALSKSFFYKKYWNKFFLLLLVSLIFGEFYIAIYLFDDVGFNLALTKRPFIWNVYLMEFAKGDIVSQILGNGRILGDFAENVGELVSLQFGVGRKYSPHSLYVGSLFEFGLLGALILFWFSCQIVAANDDQLSSDYRFLFWIFLLLGLVTPMSLSKYILRLDQ